MKGHQARKVALSYDLTLLKGGPEWVVIFVTATNTWEDQQVLLRAEREIVRKYEGSIAEHLRDHLKVVPLSAAIRHYKAAMRQYAATHPSI